MTASNILNRIIAVALLPLLVVLLWRFPVAAGPLTGIFAFYAICLFRWPNVWLLVVPAALPILDLAPWSGRFFFHGYDLLLLTTLIVLWGRGTPNKPASNTPGAWIAVGMLMISYLVSTTIGLWPFQPVDDPNAFSSYLSHYNALRVAKGFGWAVLFWWPLKVAIYESPGQSRQLLLAGLLSGLFILGLVVLWERGVLKALVEWRNEYSVLGALLDFTGGYRVTGLFSGMHVGGSAIDGYLALVLPFAAVAMMTERQVAAKLLAALALALGVYSLMVTFSRAGYAAFAISMLFLGVLAIRHVLANRVVQLRGIVLFGVVIVLWTLLLLGLYGVGGYQALFGGLVAIAGGFAADRLTRLVRFIKPWTAVAAVAVVTALLMREALMESKWNESTAVVAIGIALACGIGVPVVAMWLSRRYLRELPTDRLISVVVASVVIWFLAVPAMAGYRMESRLASVSQDVGTRTSHWQDTVYAFEPTVKNRIFGMGVGSYPRRYFMHNLGEKGLASYLFVTNGQTYLALGSGNFNLMQRVHIKPDTTYRMIVKLRTKGQKSSVWLSLCRKNLLYSQRWQPNCVAKKSKLDGTGRWETFEWLLDSGEVGRSPALSWPTVIVIANWGAEVIDVGQITMLDPLNVDVISNGDFSAGSDRWFMVSDFAHLAWHAKSLFLHTWFEQGWFGILSLVLFLIASAVGFGRRFAHGDPLAGAALGGLLGVCAVGLFGTVIDMPRVAFLFFLVALWGLIPYKPGPDALPGNRLAT